jgi:hypothetical protein
MQVRELHRTSDFSRVDLHREDVFCIEEIEVATPVQSSIDIKRRNARLAAASRNMTARSMH